MNSRYHYLLDQLEQIQSEYPSATKITWSTPVDNQQLDQGRIRLKTALEKILPTLIDDHSQVRKIVQQHVETFRQLSVDTKGFVLFLSIPTEKDQEMTEVTLSLPVPLMEYQSVAKVFNPFPLLAAEQLFPDTLVVVLHSEQAELYWFAEKLNHLSTLENPYQAENPPKYIEMYTPSRSTSIVQGAGADKHQRRLDKVREEFLWQVCNEISTLSKQNKPQQILVFSPHSFSALLADCKDSLERHLHIPVEIMLQTIGPSEQLETLVTKKVKRMREKTFRSFQRQAKDKSLAVTRWQEISDQVSRGQLEKIWLSPELNRSGYIYDNNTALTYKVGDTAKAVDDIVPYLSWQLYQQRATIYPDLSENPTVFAMRRY